MADCDEIILVGVGGEEGTFAGCACDCVVGCIGSGIVIGCGGTGGSGVESKSGVGGGECLSVGVLGAVSNGADSYCAESYWAESYWSKVGCVVCCACCVGVLGNGNGVCGWLLDRALGVAG